MAALFSLAAAAFFGVGDFCGAQASKRTTVVTVVTGSHVIGLVLFLVLAGTLGVWTLLVFGAIPHLFRTLRVYNRPRPEQPPPNFPIWPLWYVAWAFAVTRMAGGLRACERAAVHRLSDRGSSSDGGSAPVGSTAASAPCSSATSTRVGCRCAGTACGTSGGACGGAASACKLCSGSAERDTGSGTRGDTGA